MIAATFLSLADEHELIAVGVETHRQMRRLAVFLLRLADQSAAVCDHLGGSGDHVRDLDADAGPSAFPLTAAVDADGGTGDFQFGNMAVGADDLRAENLLIEPGRPRQVRCPDDVLDAFDLHFSGVERKLILINDASVAWSDVLKVHLVGKNGEVLESSSREVSLEPRSQASFALNELFERAGISAIDGYLIAELGAIRTARRVLDAPVDEVCAHNVEIQERVVGEQVQVHIDANCFIYELSLLPELVALDRVAVSAERITLLPGESIDITIDCSSAADAKKVASQIEEITWSLNRLMN